MNLALSLSLLAIILSDPVAKTPLLLQGLELLQKGNTAAAYDHFLRGAILGDPDAIYNIGSMYLYGLGVQKSQREAARWYHLAAEDHKHREAEKALKELLPILRKENERLSQVYFLFKHTRIYASFPATDKERERWFVRQLISSRSTIKLLPPEQIPFDH